MAGSLSEDYGVGRSSEGISTAQRCGEALAEWRSSEQVENGSPSTSPPYWDTEDDDDDCGPKPSELYGKFTWRIENFSQISKRELRSNAFEVGGYKWYILIYPQGCDVCNHLSLFLCVANHDKLLPGWSHFAQFTIAVVNKDPKKSKYSDTLHRFWKKEHDWGWKKFMELSKVLDGFIETDTLVIKAQVQVIREKSHRPFRCLDCQYRRELVRVYLTNVEQICRRFVEERRGKLGKLIEDKTRWSSFCAFWLGVDQNARRRMSREKSDVILKVVVKQFFVEKEVTSTLVMDSLYSGLKALECQSKSKKRRAKLMDIEETPDPIVRAEKDMFVLADDVLLLLERAALEPLPPKDEKGPQNRTKDGSSGEDFNKDSIERDERRLTELGRRTVEIFILAHIFSNIIEVAYQEAVALKRQEELIREEEAAGQAENEQKARRGATEKEKRAKKKQNKQKRSSRKAMDKGRDEKSDVVAEQVKQQCENSNDVGTMKEFSVKRGSSMLEKPDAHEDVSDLMSTGDDVIETIQPDLEDRYASPVNWDTDTSEVNPATEASSSGVSDLPSQNGRAGKKSSSVVDDSSSTCSTDSVLSVMTNGPYKGSPLPNYRSQTSPDRGKNQHSKQRRDQTDWAPEMDNQSSEFVADVERLYDASGTCRATGPEAEPVDLPLKDRRLSLKDHMIQKADVGSRQKKLIVHDQADVQHSSEQTMMVEAHSSLNSPTRSLPSNMQPKSMEQSTPPSETYPTKETFPNLIKKTAEVLPLKAPSTQGPAITKLETQKFAQKVATPTKSTFSEGDKPTALVSGMSRPSSAPLIPGPRPSVPIVSMARTAPQLARSASAAGHLASEPSTASHTYAPSYRNAIMGKTLGANSGNFTPRLSTSVVRPSPSYSQPFSSTLSSPIMPPPSSGMKDQSSVRSDFTFGSVTPEILQNRPQWLESSEQDTSTSHSDPSMLGAIQNLNIYSSSSSAPRTHLANEFPATVSANASTRQAQGVLPDEFPHLDIINYLFEDEHSIGRGSTILNPYNGHNDRPFNRQFTFPGDMTMSANPGPSVNYSGFGRFESYPGDRMHQAYGSFDFPFDGLRDIAPMVGLSSYGNGHHMDGLSQNQWPIGGADLSMLTMRNTDGDGYSYQLPDYSNMVRGVNGYNVFRPSNGH